MAGPPDHLAEGFNRADPAELARFSVIARAWLMESQSHLRDAGENRYITEQRRLELDGLAETALREVTSLLEYLQTAEALQKDARHAGTRRVATRQR